ncbi:ribonuclease catalytic domain-containing protein [Pandoraea apista]|uniref:RNB domain-containing ribonuclease n=1 Tax=Pandoraea apista TaxID=93218 RepID=A0ABX9ZMP2_9BURK|nr:RNB domain-containing ribonuclease [Pandoraea apista]PTD98799.1 ribonuclease II [Pandoraea apista]RRJ30025.1 RNB domain-containing ribonuclease [Pandoraea apista]RRJ80135.1 RNB domain-containing ribonuclease [Pandoraea apista]RSD12862.1 RNB domain-containing ribonuclease [Pandoraea apista]RSK78520.1 RNB domain-containing ribonuclease [Pandoraea apista]
MNIFFEESGGFKAGTVLSQQGESYQVELPGGRRSKIKGRDVLLRFESPSPSELIAQAQAAAQDIDMSFLWECAPAEEFPFPTLAAEYFGETASAAQQAGLALALQASPIYFRRKGRGQYQRAPQEQIQAALAGLARKQQQAELQASYAEQMIAGTLPDAIKGKELLLLFRPDKNAIEWKALDAAASALGKTHAEVMLACGGIASPRAYHEAAFLYEYFPRGTGFPDVGPVPMPGDDLPLADVQAFSIDDSTTTEIDDALSVQLLPDGLLRVGIHIAAPALGITRGDAIDEIARVRLSTVYAPGEKITMLPDAVVEAYTLAEGGARPALSLYVVAKADTYEIVATETRAELVPISANLRHNELDSIITAETLADGSGDYPHKEELRLLWPFAQSLYDKRQAARVGYGLRPEVQNKTDFSFYVDGEHVTIKQRLRGAPLDLIVAEMAILANSRWGRLLAECGVPGIYRAQRAYGVNRTRMQTSPAPHEGLGVEQYAWSTSPLRRYVDLVNQWQLIACVRHGVTAKLAAPFKPKDADLYVTVSSFEAAYAAYGEHQSRMERYWCLRWLLQENKTQVQASVLKGDTVRLNDIPLTLIVPGLGLHARGTQIMLDVLSLDVVTLGISVRLSQVLDASQSVLGDDDDEGEGGAGEGGDGGDEADGADGAEGAEGANDADGSTDRATDDSSDGADSSDGRDDNDRAESRGHDDAAPPSRETNARVAQPADAVSETSPLAAALMAAGARDATASPAC